MKKSVLVFSITTLLVLGGFNIATAQEQPAPKRIQLIWIHRLSLHFYYAVEDDKTEDAKGSGKIGAGAIGALIAGAVIVVGAATAFFL